MPAGLSSLVVQVQAVFTAIAAFAVLGERPSPIRLLGMLIALAGIGVAAVDEGASGPLGAGTVGYVAWVTTVFGFGAWGWLLRRHPASTVAPFSLLVPVFGMSSAALFLGEQVSPLRWCAAVLLVGGVALTSVTPRRRPVVHPVDSPASEAVVGRS